ncbi:MAG TPA: hypothetical protein VGL77_18515 [Armatimonadota bacterium]|jgi:cellobiose phosphorylase
MTQFTEYYSFDDVAREVRFLRSDPPTPWMNYLSNGNFHVMLSQAGGGMVWYKSPQIWRLTRYRFYNLPMDRPGPYLYLRDAETGAHWSVNGEPCPERPDAWSSAHGLGYTRFDCAHQGIAAHATYFVPPTADVLVWRITVRNTGTRARKIDLFGYVEFSLMEYLREVQWQCYVKHQLAVRHHAACDSIIYRYGADNQLKPEETPQVYFAANRPLTGWDCNRDVFIGPYRSEENPLGLERGCQGSNILGGDGCGALQCTLDLAPGEEQEVIFFLGTAASPDDAATRLAALRAPGAVDAHWAALGELWQGRLRTFQATLPDADAARMVNTWNPYQVERNFLFSRSISYYATGFRGVGFRDTAQDIVAYLQLDPLAARAKIHELLAQQEQNGFCYHTCYPVEGFTTEKKEYSDDHLWPLLTVWSWIAETGDAGILDDVVPYFDGGEGTIYEHLCRSVAFSQARMGEHGIPLMLAADWNDAMSRVCREGKGESFWTAMQLGVVLPKLAELATRRGDTATATLCADYKRELTDVINDIGWDGAWYRRATMDDGLMLGTKEARQAQIFLNTQTWSVLSGMGTPERQRQAMDSVAELLDTPLGIKKVHPAVTDYPTPEAPLFAYNPGLGENAAIFCHANTWAVIAECLLGRPERAWKYYHQLIPHIALQTAGIEQYMGEPYAYASNLFGPDSDRFGLANVTWLTGTAAWMYLAITQYVLGIRPELDGLRVAPCLPPDWPGATITRVFRGCEYTIDIVNHGGSAVTLTVDGEALDGTLIPHQPGRATCAVRATLGVTIPV